MKKTKMAYDCDKFTSIKLKCRKHHLIRFDSEKSRYMTPAAIFLLTISALISFSACDAFLLDGSQNSFAQFRKWYTGLNGSLEFEFKTEQPNGLILYTDDGGTFDFFEIKLVEGAVRLRYNLGGGANIITVGREIHDGHWHKVQVWFGKLFNYLLLNYVNALSEKKKKKFIERLLMLCQTICSTQCVVVYKPFRRLNKLNMFFMSCFMIEGNRERRLIALI